MERPAKMGRLITTLQRFNDDAKSNDGNPALKYIQAENTTNKSFESMGAVNNPSISTQTPERIEFDIQECVSTFVGREDFIKELHQDLSLSRTNISSSVRPQSVVISGGAGVGKTQVTRKYIELHKESYDHVLWINTESHTTAISCFLRIAKILKIPLKNHGQPKADEDILDEIYDFICQTFALIVFDNVGSFTEDCQNEIDQLLPRTLKPGWKVPAIIILTTQRRNWTNWTFRELKGLNLSESFSLLSSLEIEDNEDYPFLVAIAHEMFQGLPLALQQVISLVQFQYKRKNQLALPKKSYSLTDLIIDVSFEKISKSSSRKGWGQIPEDLITIIQITFEQIATMKYGKLALQCLQTIALLNPDNIPAVLIDYLLRDQNRRLEDAICLLLDFNLISRYDGFYQIHRTIQAVTLKSSFTNTLIFPDVDHCLLKAIQSFTVILQHMPINSEPALEILANAIRLDDQASPYNYNDTFLKFKILVTSRLRRIGWHTLDIQICQHAFKTNTNIWGLNHRKTVYFNENLALALYSSGNYEDAIKLHRNVLRIRNVTLGSAHPVTLETKHNLGLKLYMQGEYEEAEQIYRDVLQIQIKKLGLSHSDTLRVKYHLAVVLNKTCQHEEAEKLCREILRNQITKSRRNYPKTLGTKQCLALALYKQNKYEEAEKLYEAVLQTQIEERGSKHPETMETKRNLLFVLYAKCEYEKAEQLRHDVFQTQTNSLSSSYPHNLIKNFVLTNQSHHKQTEQLGYIKLPNEYEKLRSDVTSRSVN